MLWENPLGAVYCGPDLGAFRDPVEPVTTAVKTVKKTVKKAVKAIKKAAKKV